MTSELLASFSRSVSLPWGDLVLHLGERDEVGPPSYWAVATGGEQLAFALRLALGHQPHAAFGGALALDEDAVAFVGDEVAILTERHGYGRASSEVWRVVVTRDGVQRARVPGLLDRARPPRREGRFLRLQRDDDGGRMEPVAWVDLEAVDAVYGPAAHCAVARGQRVEGDFLRAGRGAWGRGEACADGQPVSMLALPAMDDGARAALFAAWGERHDAPLQGALRLRGWCSSADAEGPWLLVFDGRAGAPLSARVGTNAPLAPDHARRVLEAVADALAVAHARGRWHGYLWPGGVFVDDDAVRLRDVGLDRALDAVGLPWTVAPRDAPADEAWASAAPEVLGGGGDPRSDVWSFGLLAYRVRTGARYWRNERDATALRAEILGGARPLPSVRARRQRVDDVAFPDAAFDAWFGRCVARDPRRRFGDIREAFAALSW